VYDCIIIVIVTVIISKVLMRVMLSQL